MPWIPRGLREGIVTSRYPHHPDGYGPGFRGTIDVGRLPVDDVALEGVSDICPTDAISVASGRLQVDRGCCILCGRCARLYPRALQFDSTVETSAILRHHLVVPDLDEDDGSLELARRELNNRVKALRRSVHIRHVDAGSDGSEEWEVAALTNPIYDVQRLGIFFTASPKHADVLLVTGVGSAGMLGPLRHTFDVMPDPKVVIAAGVDAISGGLVGTGYGSLGGIDGAVPVDVFVPGSPPSPFGLLHGILVAVGLLPVATGTRAQPARSDTPGTAHGPAIPEDPLREAGP
jgi:Ni,Fe-hydrogenase III small subunit/formate hydrogenlyase subunit 6/NADH:ubiquinone oxidoreductase subunit I